MEQLSGGEALIRALHDEGVEFLFGYPGGAVLHIYDALFQQDKVEHILVRHEQAATHAADGYARATGKPGVVLVTSGPGATNAITGIATAYMDSIPMVVISGQVESRMIGSDAFQETDMVGVSRPIVKHSFMVQSAADIPAVVKKAFHIASTGRPGPVVIDVPKDATDPKLKIDYEYPQDIKLRSYQVPSKGHSGQIKKAVEVLLGAKRPMIYTGGGVIQGEGCEELTQLTRALGYPITNTLMGLGAYPSTDKQFLGMLGMHGTYEANMAMQECDVLIAIGSRFDDRVIGNPDHFLSKPRKIIHIDIDPASISKRVKIDVPIVGNVKSVLEDMNEIYSTLEKNHDKNIQSDWIKTINEWKAKKSLSYKNSDEVIKPQYVVEELHKVTNGDAFITSDVGQHQMWAAQYYPFNKPRRWLNSGGLGTMGVGLPYAMGAQLAHPEAQVACITGEASIQMCIQELSTCKQFHLPVKIINLNNRYMGMVRQWQEFFYGNRYAESYMDALPDFVKLAESYGHIGLQIEKPSEVTDALKEAFSEKNKERLVFLDFLTDQTENVYPMVPNGKGLSQMILSEDL